MMFYEEGSIVEENKGEYTRILSAEFDHEIE